MDSKANILKKIKIKNASAPFLISFNEVKFLDCFCFFANDGYTFPDGSVTPPQLTARVRPRRHDGGGSGLGAGGVGGEEGDPGAGAVVEAIHQVVTKLVGGGLQRAHGMLQQKRARFYVAASMGHS